MKKNQELRIIAGTHRSRRIKFIPTQNLRPTPDRLRETLFNWLAPYIENAVCLDLFAGSGILSFEAISRGAKEVYTIEANNKAAAQIQHSAELLDIHRIKIYHAKFPNIPHEILKQPYDIIFLDPPFDSDLLSTALHWIAENQLLKPEGIIYLEKPNKTILDLKEFSIIRQTKIGFSEALLIKQQ